MTGKIIILNGTSSAGKSSIVHALQEIMDEPYLEAGFDKFLWMLPAKFLKRPLYLDVLDYEPVFSGGEPRRALRPRRIGFQLVAGMHRAVAALAQAGNNVILDHLLVEPGWVEDCARLFSDYWALMVGVRCPLAVIIERESQRGDRTPGIAPGHYDLVHAYTQYDLEVDTSLLSAVDCAAVIKQRILDKAPPQALRALKRRAEGAQG
jgi:chloramphenicol 3-O phosphotransferase